MKGNDIDKFDEVFRSRLQDFEAETHPDDWKAIEKRLPASRVSLYRNLRYWAAAAVIALLMVTGSLYLFDGDTEDRQIADQVKKQTEQLQSRMKEEVAPLAATVDTPKEADKPAVRRMLATKHTVPAGSFDQPIREVLPSDSDNSIINQLIIPTDPVEVKERVDDQADDEPQPVRSVEPVAPPEQTSQKQSSTNNKPTRKWRFGMGGGGLSMAAGNVVPQFSTPGGLRAEELEFLNTSMPNAIVRAPLPKTNVEHKIPISFGLSISRALNNRFSLQTGLTYSYLLSEWETNGEYHNKVKQGLHFVGIPLSVNYTIAEWQRFRLYATSGVAAEMNVGGRRNTKLYEGDEQKSKISEDVRMKPLMWSLNARVGVSYPLLRFLGAYAEGGAGYYFDNGSDIETIRSEKPFNVNFQFGLRVGF